MDLSSNHSRDAASVVREMNTLIDPVDHNQPGAREALLALSHRLTAMLETPSETIQRIGWAEVFYSVFSKKEPAFLLRAWTDSI